MTLQPEIDLLVDFVNTHDLEEETDAIASSQLLQAWIEEQTGEHLPEVEEEDLRRVHRLREALRALMRANNGDEPQERELEALREAAARSRYRLAFGSQGKRGLAPARVGLGGFESRLLLALERLQCED